MAGSISEFKSSFVTDLARPSRFNVQIPIPLTLIPFRNTARQLTFRCETTQLPSRTFATAEQKFGSNPVEKYPYQSEYNEIEMTFIVSDDMSEKLFFDAWMEYISPTYTFNFKYKSDYCSTLTVNQYDVKNDLTYSINLIDAYPISMNQLDLDWSSTENHKLTVVFAYTYWVNNSIQSLGTSLLQTVISDIVAGFGGLGVDNSDPDIPDSVVAPSEYTDMGGYIVNSSGEEQDGSSGPASSTAYLVDGYPVNSSGESLGGP